MSVRDDDEFGDGGGNGDDFADLPGLGKDGGGDGTQQDQIDEGGALDKLLEDHISKTSNDPRTPAAGKDKGAQGDGTQQRRSQQGSGQQRDVRGQAQDDRRGQGDGQRPAAGAASHTPRQLTSLFKSGADGAIYDANGTKVANGGLERRVAERVLGYYRGMETEHNALKQRMDAYEGANAAAREAGLSIEEHAMGMRLMSAWKADPLKTINYLLTQAQARNIDVTPIRQGSGFDPAAVDSLLERRFKALEDRFAPLLSNIEQQREDAEIRDQVQTEITAFFEEFPTAEMHRPVLGVIMQRTGYTPREAWFAVQTEAAKAGWDLTKPLPQQAQASHGNGTGNGAASTGVGRTRNLPDMSGRGAGGGTRNARTVRAGSREVANVDASYDDIINDVLAEHSQQQ